MAQPLRIKFSSYVPAVIMLAARACTGSLVQRVYPALRPTTDAAKAKWSGCRDAWNFALFIFSGICCGSTAVALWRDGQIFVDGSWVAVHCKPVEGTWMRALSTLFTLSKLVEMGDTCFLITLGTKPPEFLHLYHRPRSCSSAS